MRAVIITRSGGPEVLEIQERPTPSPGPGQVRVRVQAAGVNRADLLQRRGHYPAPPGFPQEIPGLEYAGEIEAVGPDVQMRRPGDRVMGIVGGGAYAETVVVHERETIRVPEGLSFLEAAAIPEAFITAWDAIVLQCGLETGDRLLIHAVGSGVGLAALQIARGLEVWTAGTSRTVAKLDPARAWGLDHAIPVVEGRFADAVLEATGGRGVDVVLDFIGAAYLSQNLQVLASGGRLIVVGLMGGARGEMPLEQLLTRRLTVRGTTLRARPIEAKIELARAFEARLVPLFERGRLRPNLQVSFPMMQAAEAHRQMEANDTFGKLVLTW